MIHTLAEDFIKSTRIILPLLAIAFFAGSFVRTFKRIPRHGDEKRPWFMFIILSVFTVILAASASISGWNGAPGIVLSFLVFTTLQWVCFLFSAKGGMRAELTGFFLSELGLAVTAVAAPYAMWTQLLCIGVGVAGFYVIRGIIRNVRFASGLRFPCAAVCLALLVYSLIAADEVNGARNWVTLFGFTFQPSEIAKLFYVIACALPGNGNAKKWDMYYMTGVSVLCVICLALMNDFGTALVFFAAYLAAVTLRRKGYLLGTVAIAAALSAGLLVIRFSPHTAARFASWGHAWEVANDAGYQQTRAMSAAASGGFLGLGAGKGWLSGIFAADTDLVFGVICEELGLIVGCIAVGMVLLCAMQVLRNSIDERDPFLLSCAVIASMMLLIQTTLNVLGSMDILPFTGVTFPLVSRGGSSAIVCWWLLAFIGKDYRTSDMFSASPVSDGFLKSVAQMDWSEEDPEEQKYPSKRRTSNEKKPAKEKPEKPLNRNTPKASGTKQRKKPETKKPQQIRLVSRKQKSSTTDSRTSAGKTVAGEGGKRK